MNINKKSELRNTYMEYHKEYSKPEMDALFKLIQDKGFDNLEKGTYLTLSDAFLAKILSTKNVELIDKAIEISHEYFTNSIGTLEDAKNFAKDMINLYTKYR